MRAKRMMVFLGESDQWHHQPLYLAVLEHLRRAGCAGATVTRGIAGFGAHSQIRTANILRLSVDLPVVITAVDTAERIARVLPEVSAMLSGGLIVVDDTEVCFQSPAFRGGLPDVQVGDLMTREPEAVTPDTPIAEVVERLCQRDYTLVPVVDADGRVVGVIGDSDLLRAGLTAVSLSLHKAIGPDHLRESLAHLRSAGGTVRDAMTTPVVTVTPATPLAEAAHLMHTRALKRLPVIDVEGRLVGVIARLDILKSIASGYAQRTMPLARTLPQEHRTAGQLMDRDIPAVRETAPLADVAGKLLDCTAKRVVVVNDRAEPVGIVTDTDLVARIDPAQRPGLLTQLRSRWNEAAHQQVLRASGQRAADIMTAPVIVVSERTPVIEALALAVERGVKRLPVVDAQGRVVGIVTRPALLAASLDVAAETP